MEWSPPPVRKFALVFRIPAGRVMEHIPRCVYIEYTPRQKRAQRASTKEIKCATFFTCFSMPT
jgi:hypothetical protein